MLGSRLQTVANFVPAGSKIADIGTDHAYLPIELVKSGKCAAAIAADVNNGPLLAAKHSVAEAMLADKIELRLGNGLSVLREGEVDIAVFCGMGGNLMRQLLAESQPVVKSLKGLILQPQQGYRALREYIYKMNWHIEDEALAKEDGRIYQIIYAVPGQAAVPEGLFLEVGAVLSAKRGDLFTEMINEFCHKTRRTLQNMEKSPTAQRSEHYQQLQKYLSDLEGLL